MTSSLSEKEFPSLSVGAKKKKPATKRVKSYSSGLSLSPGDGGNRSNGIGRNWQQELDTQKEIVENLKQDLINLNERLASKSEELEKYQSKNELLGEILNKKEDAEAKSTLVEKEKNELQQSIKDLQTKLTKAQDEVKDKDKKLKNVSSLLEGQQADTRHQEQEIARLTSSEEKLRSQIKQHGDSDKIIKDLQSKIRELETKNKNESNQLSTYQRDLDAANKKT